MISTLLFRSFFRKYEQINARENIEEQNPPIEPTQSTKVGGSY
jgi:hypothetical protein